ncbi:hypothetical protein GGS23DRAFT_599448 [Durotheca rogersii]|uniref:uncharacterized protein n=1 Tax=Durotheca rogersii TaxID=419775 RepID=UPI00221F88FE|nr:uncharacterized protein GGS23DRAFT_599448 [Durotheca rogersii]KAI5860337.1 hypothetical protein GGS23DRAFT_599448 [Durotheca rogersii]
MVLLGRESFSNPARIISMGLLLLDLTRFRESLSPKSLAVQAFLKPIARSDFSNGPAPRPAIAMSLGPLLTDFTPPDDCTASSALHWVKAEAAFYWLHERPASHLALLFSPEPVLCLVQGYAPWATLARANSSRQIAVPR